MSPAIDVLITIANCSQNAAASLLAVSIAVMRLLKRFPSTEIAGREAFFIIISRSAMRIAGGSLVWMCIASIPEMVPLVRGASSGVGEAGMTIFVVRYAAMLLLAAISAFSWAALAKKVSRLESGPAVADRT